MTLTVVNFSYELAVFDVSKVQFIQVLYLRTNTFVRHNFSMYPYLITVSRTGLTSKSKYGK